MANLEEKVRSGRFVITAEIVPPLSAAPARLLAEAELIKGKVDAINVTDAAAGKTTMASFAAAALLAANGYEPILQVTCRDRNRIALAGDLIGAAAQGIRNLLILKGDDPKGGGHLSAYKAAGCSDGVGLVEHEVAKRPRLERNDDMRLRWGRGLDLRGRFRYRSAQIGRRRKQRDHVGRCWAKSVRSGLPELAQALGDLDPTLLRQ